jgi:ankyrin repeat protein
MFSGESVKQQRVEKLQVYLRDCIRYSGERQIPSALLKFLRVDPACMQPDSAASATGDSGSGSREPGPLMPFENFTRAFVPEKPDDVNEGLREAIKSGDEPQCLSLIKSNADPNYRDRQGNTPLHMACLFQRTEVAKALLLAGSDLTLKNGAGELPERMASVSLKMKFNTFKQTGQL